MAGELEQAHRSRAAQLTPKQQISHDLEVYGPRIRQLLTGTGLSPDAFGAQIVNACRQNPDLLKCGPTVIGAALQAAQLGLTPNDSRSLCWIIPYGKEARFQLGYGGVLELARRAMPGIKFDGRAVYPGDEFDIDYGAERPLRHRPALAMGKDRGGVAYAWYVKTTYPDGAVLVHALDRDGVEYHRKFSKMKNGPMWTESYDAGALKSVVLDMKRWLPSSAALAAAFTADEAVIELDDVQQVGEIDHTPDEPDEDMGG